MCDHGRHLADRGHLLHMQHALMRLLQFARFLLNPVFQSVGPGGDLCLCELQLIAHFVERLRHLADFVVRHDRNLRTQLTLGDPLGTMLQYPQRSMYDVSDEHPATEPRA